MPWKGKVREKAGTRAAQENRTTALSSEAKPQKDLWSFPRGFLWVDYKSWGTLDLPRSFWLHLAQPNCITNTRKSEEKNEEWTICCLVARDGLRIEIIKSRLNSAKTSLCLLNIAELSQKLERSAEEEAGSRARKKAVFLPVTKSSLQKHVWTNWRYSPVIAVEARVGRLRRGELVLLRSE